MSVMEKRFDQHFSMATDFASLDRLLERPKKNMDGGLLRVPDHPETVLGSSRNPKASAVENCRFSTGGAISIDSMLLTSALAAKRAL